VIESIGSYIEYRAFYNLGSLNYWTNDVPYVGSAMPPSPYTDLAISRTRLYLDESLYEITASSLADERGLFDDVRDP
jgi:hypothetical protein